jgi:uncharacterized coiled-coil DUF342 family protein
MDEERQEILWADLLEMKSIGYLIRAKIEQNLSLVISNISSSFMGNRQLANHNTDDVKHNLNKICSVKFDKTEVLPKYIQLKFLKHRQKLNKQLISNSAAMLDAVENLQEVHKKIMKTNEEIIKFNSEIINLSTQLLADENLDSNYNLDSEAMNIDLDSLEKQCVKSKKDCEKLTKKIDVVFRQNLESQQTILNKRQKIMKNRKNISETRKQINLFL